MYKLLLIAIAALLDIGHGLATDQKIVVAEHGQRYGLAQDLFTFHRHLVEIESITGNEKAVGDYLAIMLGAQGFHVEKQYISKDPDRFNVHAWAGSKQDAKIVVSSHIDTVPPFYKYKRLDNGTISGRGSVDAKASVAAQVFAVLDLLDKGSLKPEDIALLYVVGEETNAIGMRTANGLKLKPDTIIFGEPTEGKLASGHKGNIGVKLTAIGKSAHSGYPWLGRSANEVLVSALSALMRLGTELPTSDKYGQTTINIGKIEGGVAANVVAESASADIAVRIAEGTVDMIKQKITKAVHKAVGDFTEGELKPEDVIQIEWTSTGYGPVPIDADVPGFEVMTVNYGTDIPYFNLTGEGQKRYLFGPGSIMVAHSDHEALTEDELSQAVEGYKKIILHALDA